jgi:MFS superfamily sulfate permease-like transporter
LRDIPIGYTVVMLATATVAVLIGFTVAILVGLVLSALLDGTRSHQRELERLVSVPLPDTEIWPEADPYSARVGLIVLPDRVSVASARELSRILGGDIRASEAVIMDFSRTTYLDDTAATLIGKVIEGKPVVVSGLHGEPANMLTGFGTLRPEDQRKTWNRPKA